MDFRADYNKRVTAKLDDEYRGLQSIVRAVAKDLKHKKISRGRAAEKLLEAVEDNYGMGDPLDPSDYGT